MTIYYCGKKAMVSSRLADSLRVLTTPENKWSANAERATANTAKGQLHDSRHVFKEDGGEQSKAGDHARAKEEGRCRQTQHSRAGLGLVGAASAAGLMAMSQCRPPVFCVAANGACCLILVTKGFICPQSC